MRSFGWSFAFVSKHNERCERQYRNEPPPACALLKPRSPSFKSLLRPLFKITEHRLIHRHIHIHIRSHISQKMHTYTYMCHHESSRTPQHSNWNCESTNRPQHMHMEGHMVCVIELLTHQKFESFKKIISATTKFEFESAN